MNTRYLVYVILIVVAFSAGAIFGDVFRSPALAQNASDGAKDNAPAVSTDDGKPAENATPQNDAPATAPSNGETAKPENDITAVLKPAAIVTAFPYRSETEYEMDPFDEDRIRSTETKVKNVCIVRADGKMEIVEVK